MYLNNFLQNTGAAPSAPEVSFDLLSDEVGVLERLNHTAIALEAICFLSENTTHVDTQIQCEQLLRSACNDSTNVSELLLGPTGHLAEGFALEALPGLVIKITEAISNLIERIMEIFNRVRGYVTSKIPSTRDKLVKLRTSLLDKNELMPGEDKVTLNTHKKFFKVENRPLKADVTTVLKDTVGISEQLAEETPRGIKAVLEVYTDVLTSMTDVGSDVDPVQIGLETEQLLNTLVNFDKMPGMSTTDPRWKGYDVSKIPLLNNRAMFFIRPLNLTEGSIQSQFDTLAKGTVTITDTTSKPNDDDGLTSFKALHSSDIVEGIDYLLEIIDGMQKYNDDSYIKKLPSSINDIKKKLIAFNESAVGDDVNAFVRKNRRNVSNALTGILKTTVVMPGDNSKYLSEVVAAYTALYSAMASNLK